MPVRQVQTDVFHIDLPQQELARMKTGTEMIAKLNTLFTKEAAPNSTVL